jgi:hypothetical protein
VDALGGFGVEALGVEARSAGSAVEAIGELGVGGSARSRRSLTSWLGPRSTGSLESKAAREERIGAIGWTAGQLITWAAPLAIAFMAPRPAQGLELSGGLSLGASRRLPFRASPLARTQA